MRGGGTEIKLKRMHSIIREITYLLYKSQHAKKKERNETRKEGIWHETGNN